MAVPFLRAAGAPGLQRGTEKGRSEMTPEEARATARYIEGLSFTYSLEEMITAALLEACEMGRQLEREAQAIRQHEGRMAGRGG